MMVSCRVKLNGTEAKDNCEDFGSAGGDGCVHRGFQLVMRPCVGGHQSQKLDDGHHQRPLF